MLKDHLCRNVVQLRLEPLHVELLDAIHGGGAPLAEGAGVGAAPVALKQSPDPLPRCPGLLHERVEIAKQPGAGNDVLAQGQGEGFL